MKNKIINLFKVIKKEWIIFYESPYFLICGVLLVAICIFANDISNAYEIKTAENRIKTLQYEDSVMQVRINLLEQRLDRRIQNIEDQNIREWELIHGIILNKK
jgi:hypothetical protein